MTLSTLLDSVTMEDGQTTALHVRDIPAKLVKQLKRLAVDRDTTLKAIVVESCEHYLREQRKKSVRHN